MSKLSFKGTLFITHIHVIVCKKGTDPFKIGFGSRRNCCPAYRLSMKDAI